MNTHQEGRRVLSRSISLEDVATEGLPGMEEPMLSDTWSSWSYHYKSIFVTVSSLGHRQAQHLIHSESVDVQHLTTQTPGGPTTVRWAGNRQTGTNTADGSRHYCTPWRNFSWYKALWLGFCLVVYSSGHVFAVRNYLFGGVSELPNRKFS